MTLAVLFLFELLFFLFFSLWKNRCSILNLEKVRPFVQQGKGNALLIARLPRLLGLGSIVFPSCSLFILPLVFCLRPWFKARQTDSHSLAPPIIRPSASLRPCCCEGGAGALRAGAAAAAAAAAAQRLRAQAAKPGPQLALLPGALCQVSILCRKVGDKASKFFWASPVWN